MGRITLGPIVNLEEFVGRKQCLNVFEKYIYSSNLLVLGEDGIGKSSFLNLMEEYCHQNNLVSCKIKVYEKESVQSFAKRFYETIDPLIPLQKTQKKRFTVTRYFIENTIWWWNYFRQGFKEKFYQVGRYIGREIEESTVHISSFKQYLDIVNDKLDQNVIVFVDDIHLIDSNKQVISLMKNMLWTSFSKAKYVLFINNKSLLATQKEKFNSISKNKPMQCIELSPFSEEEARAYVIRRFKRENIEVSEDAMNRIFVLSGYYPYYMSIICYVIFKIIGMKKSVDEMYMDENFGSITSREECNGYLYNLLSDEQKMIIEKIAPSDRGLNEIVLKEFPDINMNDEEFKEIIQTLRKNGYLRKENDLLTVFHPIFNSFVRKITEGKTIKEAPLEEENIFDETIEKVDFDMEEGIKEESVDDKESLKKKEEIYFEEKAEEEREEDILEEDIKEEVELKTKNKNRINLDELKQKISLISIAKKTSKSKEEAEKEEEESKESNKSIGKKAEAIRLGNRSVDYYLKAVSKTTDIYWKSIYYIDIATCLERIGKYESAAKYLIKASEISDNDDEKAKLILQARECLIQIRKKEDVEDLLEKALKIYLNACNKTSETYWKAKYQWKAAECLLLLNRRKEADELSEGAIAYFVETAETTNDYYWKANYYKLAADCLKKLGKVEDYQKTSETIVKYYFNAIEKVSGAYWKAKYIFDVAEYLESNGRIDEAYKLYSDAATFYIQASKSANDPIRKVEDLQLSSGCLVKMNKAREAEEICKEITKHYLSNIKNIEDADLRAKSLKNIGDSYKSIGKISEALGYYVDASKAIVEPEEEAKYLSLAVGCLLELQRDKDAEKMVREVIKNYKEASNKTSDLYWKAKYLSNAQDVLLKVSNIN
ncbi:MAG: hypothetical protein QMD92_07625 [bacterium]|nr:hypothetical protein [bacterium]